MDASVYVVVVKVDKKNQDRSEEARKLSMFERILGSNSMLEG